MLFLEGCSSCVCGSNGKLHCSTDAFCNFEAFADFEIEKTVCEDAGGFHQELCSGNIFAMRCTNEFFCQCGGDNSYTCPEDYSCLTEFRPLRLIKK